MSEAIDRHNRYYLIDSPVDVRDMNEHQFTYIKDAMHRKALADGIVIRHDNHLWLQRKTNSWSLTYRLAVNPPLETLLRWHERGWEPMREPLTNERELHEMERLQGQ
jgi:hypothetical protein